MNSTRHTFQKLLPRFFREPLVGGLLVFLALLAVVADFTYQRQMLYRSEKTRELNRELYLANENLVSVLNNSLAATKTLSYIITRYGVHGDFDILAKQILDNNKNIDALELVQGGTITNIYPLAENQSALGYNILEDSLVNKEAYRAIRENKLFFAGPIQLKQGYKAIVGRLPIFQDGKFWGFSAVLIKLSTLVKAAHLDYHGRKDIVFQLSKTDPNTGKEQDFLPNSSFAKRKFSASVHVPMGDWKLQAGLIAPPYDFHPRVLIFGVLLSAIGGIFTWYFLRQPKRLRDLVNEKTILLQKSEEKYYSFFDQSSDAILVIDKDGHLLEVNQRLCLMLDYSREELLGMNFRDVLAAAGSGNDPMQYAELMSGDQVIRQRKFVTKKGDLLTMEITSKKMTGDSCLVTCRDVTEKLKAEKELRESEEKFRSLVEQNFVGVFIIQDNVFKYVNPGFTSITGYSEKELLDNFPIDRLIHEEDRYKINPNDQQSGTTKRLQYSVKGIRKNGAVLYLEVITSLILYQGKPAYIGTVIDNTAQVEEENKINKAVNDAQENERMQIGMELHDNVKQILAASLLNLDFARSNLSDEKLSGEVLDNSKGYLREAIEELRLLSHRLAPSMDSAVTLVDRIRRLIDTMNRESTLKVDIEIAEGLSIPGNDVQLALFRIIQEQFSNILKHAQATKARIHISKSNGYILMEITDNGKGFDPGKKSEGIGLTNIQRRVQILNGQLRINTGPGKGCQLLIKVPA